MKPSIALHYDKVPLPDGTAYMIAVGGILFIPRLDWQEFPLIPVLIWGGCLAMLALVLPGYAGFFFLAGLLGAAGGLLLYIVRKVARLRE
jgi:hypothetical protein